MCLQSSLSDFSTTGFLYSLTDLTSHPLLCFPFQKLSLSLWWLFKSFMNFIYAFLGHLCHWFFFPLELLQHLLVKKNIHFILSYVIMLIFLFILSPFFFFYQLLRSGILPKNVYELYLTIVVYNCKVPSDKSLNFVLFDFLNE